MSFQYPDVYSDLLCGEDAGILAGEEPEIPPAYPIDDDRFHYAGDVEDLMAELVVEQRDFFPGFDYAGRFRSRSLDAAAREEAIAWIFKVHAYYHFQPITAYLSVNYMDRFLATHRLPQANGWPLLLLSVASLSLAAKMEETFVPSLLDLQVEGARFVFEPRTIGRMELLVLNALNWRLRSITPFNFIDFFAYKVDPSGGLFRVLVSRASQIILATIQEIDFLDYWPSCVAAAAMLCAADAFSDLPLLNSGSAVSWCVGLSKEKILSCYRLMQQIVVDNKSRRKPPKILPQLRVTTPAEIRVSLQDSSPSKKRRKLSNFSWVDEVGDDDDDDDHVYGNEKERL